MKRRLTIEREKNVKKRKQEEMRIAEELYRKLYASDVAGMERWKQKINSFINDTYRGIV